MRTLVPVLVVAAALVVGGCRSSPSEPYVRAVDQGALMKRALRSYHVAYSDRSGAVGYMKVYDVSEAGGPTYQWSFVYDRDFEEKGWVDQNGTAYRYDRYPPGAQPNPREPFRFSKMPADSLANNAARMLGLDPAAEHLTFPVAKEGDVK
jgi:hypothetical protein